MSLMILDRLDKDYAGHQVFRNISCTITKGERIGLVGPNGTGKSTLLKILAGLEDPSKGQLTPARGLKVGYLEQDPTFDPELTLYQEMQNIFAEAFRLEKKLQQLEKLLHSPDLQNDPDQLGKYLLQYGKLQEAYELADGYHYDHKIKSILFGLDFKEDDLHREMVTFSGGERIRAAIGKLLLQAPDLLLLDEPTNHLDLPAIEWLESYLANYPGTILLVSHDRIFLDRVVNQIYELHLEGMEVYHGHYSFYLQEKKKRQVIQYKRYQQQQEEIAKMERFVTRFKAGTRSTQAKSVERRLAKLERIQQPEARTKTMHLPFTEVRPTGRMVLDCQGLSKNFDGRQLFTGLDIAVEARERLVILGPNGSGKSTLLKILAGEVESDTGQITFDPKVEIGYFSQHFDRIDLEKSIYDNIYQARPMDRFQIHSLAGAFLFSGEDVQKQGKVLSGGEKNRLALACLIAREPNLLLLDEPTNHLDLASRDVLVQALQKFPGTIIFVSHDRYLIQKIATREIRFEQKGNNPVIIR